MPSPTPRYGAPGERLRDALVSAAPLLGDLAWPYVTLYGAQDGPQTTIIAGIHGCEYVSIRARCG